MFDVTIGSDNVTQACNDVTVVHDVTSDCPDTLVAGSDVNEAWVVVASDDVIAGTSDRAGDVDVIKSDVTDGSVGDDVTIDS